jgi:hypothetical protein
MEWKNTVLNNNRLVLFAEAFYVKTDNIITKYINMHLFHEAITGVAKPGLSYVLFTGCLHFRKETFLFTKRWVFVTYS